MRIAIAGCPRAGKTTLAKKIGAELKLKPFSTDDLIDKLEWSEASAEVARRMAHRGPWLIEGTAVIRALRKALDASRAKPCDRLLWLDRPRESLSDGQRRMFEADENRLREIEPELRRRGVEIVREKRAATPAPAPQQKPAATKPAPDVAQLVNTDVSGTRWGGYGGRGFG